MAPARWVPESEPASELVRAASVADIAVTPAALDGFAKYIKTLLLWRSRLSLTGAGTASAIIEYHIADAFPLIRFIDKNDRVADLGSGAGFPGVPLAILRPDAHFDLVESRRKRANFLREVVRVTAIRNVTILEDRAEAVARRTPREFDVVVSRAVWRGPQFLNLSRDLLRSGGVAIAMKSVQKMADDFPQDGFSRPEILCYELAGGVRHALLIRRRDCFT